jgi:hypothetical protein
MMAGKAENRARGAKKDRGEYLGSSVGKKTRQRPENRPDELWRLEDHVCQVCFCRILSRKTDDGRLFRCSGCGLSVIAHAPSAICACGLKMKTGRDLGVRCVRNDAPSPEAPAEIVARQVVT